MSGGICGKELSRAGSMCSREVIFDTKESNEISHRGNVGRRGLTGSYESHIFQGWLEER